VAKLSHTLACDNQALLETEEFRFVGDASSWQQENGMAKMTAVKDYVVEVKTSHQEHLLLKFKLVYDWLVYCHVRHDRSSCLRPAIASSLSDLLVDSLRLNLRTGRDHHCTCGHPCAFVPQLVASVDIMSVDALGKHFPGADDGLDLSI